MARFNIDDYAGEYVMRCSTEEEANTFLEFLHREGRTWIDGTSYLNDSRYTDHESGTVYYFNEGTYSYVDYAIEEDYDVLEFNDFEWGDEPDLDIDIEEEDDKAFQSFMKSFFHTSEQQ